MLEIITAAIVAVIVVNTGGRAIISQWNLDVLKWLDFDAGLYRPCNRAQDTRGSSGCNLGV